MSRTRFTLHALVLIALCLPGAVAAMAQEATAQPQPAESQRAPEDSPAEKPLDPNETLTPAPLTNQVVDGDFVFTSPGQFTYPRDIRLSDNFGGLRFYGADSLTVQPEGAAIQFFGNNAFPFRGQLYLDSGAHNDAALIFRTAQSGGMITERMRVTSSGNVGIGTTNPFSKLTVVNDGNPAVRGDSAHHTGVWGESSSGNGVRGYSATGRGVWGSTSTGFAGFFQGDVHVQGRLTKSSGSFKIDHPLDPANKYLSHSFVESPDMMNIYNGNVVLNARGEAVVTMPAYFAALNREFRYQLTAVGAPAPNLHVAKKINGNQFKIAGGKRGMEVSWQVTGVRQDAYAEKHRIPVEEDKPAAERGTYLHPEAFGQPTAKGVAQAQQPEPNQRLTAASVQQKER